MRRDTVGVSIGYAAALTQAVAFAWYGVAIISATVHTNPISWWLWLAETFIGLLIYTDRTRDFSKWITEAVAFVGVVLVSAYLLWRILIEGDAAFILEPVEVVDFVSAIAAVAAFVFWIGTRKKIGAGTALWLFQIALVLAALPLIRSTLLNPSAEPLWPWLLWTFSFTLQLVCAIWRWDGFEPLLNPLNYAITHGVVAVIILLNVAR